MNYYEATHDKDGKFNWEGHFKWYAEQLHTELKSKDNYGLFARDVGSGKEEKIFNEVFCYECGITSHIANNQLSHQLNWNSDNLNDELNSIWSMTRLSKEDFADKVKEYQKIRLEFKKRFAENQKEIERVNQRRDLESKGDEVVRFV